MTRFNSQDSAAALAILQGAIGNTLSLETLKTPARVSVEALDTIVAAFVAAFGEFFGVKVKTLSACVECTKVRKGETRTVLVVQGQPVKNPAGKVYAYVQALRPLAIAGDIAGIDAMTTTKATKKAQPEGDASEGDAPEGDAPAAPAASLENAIETIVAAHRAGLLGAAQYATLQALVQGEPVNA
jgi:hypothetical protein